MQTQAVTITRGSLLAQIILNASLAVIGYWIGPELTTKTAQENKDQRFFSYLKGNILENRKIFWCVLLFWSPHSVGHPELHNNCCLPVDYEDLERRSCQSRKFCSCLVNQGTHSAGILECRSSMKIEIKSSLDTKSCFFHQAKPFFYNGSTSEARSCLSKKNWFGLFLDFWWHCC